MRKEMNDHHVVRKVSAMVILCALCLLAITTSSFAALVTITYKNAAGKAEPALLMRCNNKGYAVGMAGNSIFENLLSVGTMKDVPAITGLVCNNIAAPSPSVVAFKPDTIEINGVAYSLTTPGKVRLEWLSGVSLYKYAFIPLDINDNNTIVGSFFFSANYPNLVVGAMPFIAERPWNKARIICGLGSNGSIGQIPLPGCLSMNSAFATGINNSGDIIGVASGAFTSNNYLTAQKGFSFNRADIDHDDLLSAGEITPISCNNSLITIPLSINNNRKITGVALDLQYPLASGSSLVDLQGNYLRSGDNLTIAAGMNNAPEIARAILQLKFVRMSGFIKVLGASDDNYTAVNFIDEKEMETLDTPGVTEVFGTIPYTILDSGQILMACTNSQTAGSQLFTFNDVFDHLLNPSQSEFHLNYSGLLFCQASPPAYQWALPQGAALSGSASFGYGDINLANIAVGGYVSGNAVMKPLINNPQLSNSSTYQTTNLTVNTTTLRR